jgi:hypothetical protein
MIFATEGRITRIAGGWQGNKGYMIFPAPELPQPETTEDDMHHANLTGNSANSRYSDLNIHFMQKFKLFLPAPDPVLYTCPLPETT